MVTVEDLLEEQEETLGLLIKFIDNHHKTAENKITLGYMQARLKLLDDYYLEFKKVHKTLRSNTKPEQRAQLDYFKDGAFEKFIDLHLDIQAELNDVIIRLQVLPPVDRNIQHQPHGLKLPKVQIPQFAGNYQNWTNFYDVFLSLVHNHPTLSNVEKLHHLKSSLSGEAEQLLRHFTITEVNYEPAWELLTKRYKNHRLIINAHLKTLTSIPKLTQESASGLRNLLDTTTEALLSLKNLAVPTDQWDAIVVFLTEQKMDSESFKSWEQSRVDPGAIPSFEELSKFLETRFRALEMVTTSSQQLKTPQRNVNTFLTSSESCIVCTGPHRVYECTKFLNMDRGLRRSFVDKHALCANCLSQNHQTNACKSRFTCRFCHKRHHSMLHDKSQPQPTQTTSQNHGNNDVCTAPVPDASLFALHNVSSESNSSNVLLATALVQIDSPTGTHTFRALVDPCSQTSFISEDAVKRLKLSTKPSHTSVNGVGARSSQQTTCSVEFVLKSCQRSPRSHHVQALVLPLITSCLPQQKFQPHTWSHLKHLPLADPTFAQPGKIDLLLGAKVYKHIILPGLHKGSADELIAQQTTLGWIITGDSPIISTDTEFMQTTSTFHAFHSCIEIDDNLKRFWEVENVPAVIQKSDEDRRCEEFYDNTHRRELNGRYTVKLPFTAYQESVNQQVSEACCTTLGRSRYAALKRLYQVEKRLGRDPQLGKQYSDVMSNYLALGHMEPVQDSEENFRCTSGAYASYYLPHHAVVKESSVTTRVRVVFDASMQTSKGSSLNENLLVGPTIQQDLMSIIMRWRKHRIVFTADIEQMYRQIRIDSNDANYQRILWRESATQPVQEFRLLTVTFGVSSAPYLAIRTLHQLASDESQTFPKASEITLRDFYVDDLMSGCDTVNEAKEIQTQIIQMLKSGGFALKKWSSNSTEVVCNVPEDYRESKFLLNIDMDDSIKTLGVHWQPSSDVFSFKVNLTLPTDVPTKRRLLSDVAKLFDPLGWLAPAVILAKIMFQSLWLLGLTWDEPLPPDLAHKWIEYRNELPAIGQIQIPRHIGYHSKMTSCQIHGFSDASLKAYSAVVYSRITHEEGRVQVQMLTSKTRVAPVKAISVPRLELCGAVLLAKLLKTVTDSLSIDDVQVTAWTDSSVVLAWLHKPPNHWKVFVANRTTEVLEVTDSSQWRHVSSIDNPADCASRGVSPKELKDHPLWWTGPKWLQDAPHTWPSRTNTAAFSTDLDVRKTADTFCLTTIASSSFWDELAKFSTKSKVVRVLSYCLRFIRNLQEKNKSKRLHHFLQPAELQDALHKIILLVQSSAFFDDIRCLQQGKELERKSKLLPLNPFMDESGILRVGGRLQKSKLSFSTKHPIILPSTHNFTKMVIQEAHLQTLHGGPQLTLSYLRRKFWILNARNSTRFTIHQCIRCHRFSSHTQQQIMGNLPAPRVTPSRPFCHTGVDYAGPINVRVSKGRGTKAYKGYLAIFVCLSTKAIHIELVSDMTTEAFLAAFRRFTSRRGLCTDMYSDCGTNFVGAGSKLRSDFEKAIQAMTSEVGETLASNGTHWHYIPPASPHFGGLWEAGVKSTKHHLKRVIGDSTLTFEELYTVLTQIEACLNSRPLCPMTSDPTDLQVLTPGHFLVGGPLVVPPEPSLLDKHCNVLTRWRLVQQMVQDFWQIWSTEYLSRLQQRPKWVNKHRNISLNELVLVKDNRVPPSKWLLGRITAVHPGEDGQVRVVSVQCSGSIIKRPITKISPLPISTSEDPSTWDATFEN